MEKIKRIALIAMLAAVVSVVVACGRNNNNRNNNGTANNTTAQMTETSTRTGTSQSQVNDVTSGENRNETYHNGETGGVLRDMVDDVEQGLDNVTDDMGMGTTNTSGHRTDSQ